MLSMQNSLVKQAKANESQAFQRWNKKIATTPEGTDSTMDKSQHLKSKNFDYKPYPKLLAIQRMTEASEQKKNINIQLKKNRFTRYVKKWRRKFIWSFYG